MKASTRTVHIFLLALAAGSITVAPAGAEGPAGAEAPEAAAFDEKLATEVGADEYGMRQYVIAFLKAGPNRDRTPEESRALQKAHMENIGRLAEIGKLVLAGPFLDGGELRGIYLFDVKTLEEAEALTATDPAIQAGSLVMELHPWYGSAAIMKIPALHERIAKIDH